MLHEVVFLYLFLPCKPSAFLFFPLREINRLTQIRLRNALGVPHYFPVLHFPSIPFVSPYFKHFQGVSALRFASALATRERGKREKKKESLAYSIAFSYCQSTLPWLWENERKKERARRKKVRAEMREKVELLWEKRRIRGIALLRILGFTS